MDSYSLTLMKDTARKKLRRLLSRPAAAENPGIQHDDAHLIPHLLTILISRPSEWP